MRRNFWSGSRVRVRALEEKDLIFLLEERSSPDGIRQWYEDELLFPLSEKEIRDTFAKDNEEYTKDDKRIFMLETTDGAYVGQISIWYVKRRPGVFRYGIFLEEKFRGQGLAKEALIIVLDFYFNELNYRKASPCVYSYNKNSQKFHERFGFKLEARIKEELYTRGEYHDLLYYGMFKDEFNNLYKDKIWATD